jgi:hypothetical protein
VGLLEESFIVLTPAPPTPAPNQLTLVEPSVLDSPFLNDRHLSVLPRLTH